MVASALPRSLRGERRDAARVFSPTSVVAAACVCAAAPAFFVFGSLLAGWVLALLGLVIAWIGERQQRRVAAAQYEATSQKSVREHAAIGAAPQNRPSLVRDLSLIVVGVGIVSLIPLRAELDNVAMLRFTLALGGAVAVPYVVSRFVYGDRAIGFPWRGGRWRWQHWVWLVSVLVLGWLVLPYYFITSGVYENWPVVDAPDLIARLFVGVGAVGIWDELFFICVVFTLLLRHFPVWLANVLQSIVFVSFLWELGYQAWGPLLTIPFALVQGFIFVRTHSLGYVVAVHLLFDAVVFLVLVHAHNPGALPLFLV